MIADSHVHTHHSGDSDANLETILKQALRKGMRSIAITDHHDFFIEDGRFELDFEAYYKEVSEFQRIYRGAIQILFGLEQGLDPRFTDEINKVTSAYNFDFIIGSSHVAHGVDPYYPEFFEGRSVHDAMMEYFQSILENISIFNNFDVYGHIDYAIRYTPDGPQTYEYSEYQDILDEILKALINKRKGIEINTSNLRKGLAYTNPTSQVVKRYKELGGEIITVGSDSHQEDSEGVGYGFNVARQILLDAGFKHYNIFANRTPIYINL